MRKALEVRAAPSGRPIASCFDGRRFVCGGPTLKRLNALLLLALLGGLLYQAGMELRSAGADGNGGLFGGTYVLGSGQIVPAADGELPPEMPTEVSEVKIENVYQSGPGLVIMLERKSGPIEGKRYLPIIVGTNEALAIAREMATPKIVPSRPMTHDLLRTIIGSLNAQIERITVTRLAGGTFYAIITLVKDGKKVYVDARPSDSMALAIRAGAKIYVADEVMRVAGQAEVTRPGEEQGDAEWNADEPPESNPSHKKDHRTYFQNKGFY